LEREGAMSHQQRKRMLASSRSILREWKKKIKTMQLVKSKSNSGVIWVKGHSYVRAVWCVNMIGPDFFRVEYKVRSSTNKKKFYWRTDREVETLQSVIGRLIYWVIRNKSTI
jgi:hypothetical protein